MKTLTYFGHSAFQITLPDVTILVDPFISGNPLAPDSLQPDDLHPDVILITHAHGDHWGDTMEIARRSGALLIANFEITSYAQKQGHNNVHPMNTGGSLRFEWGSVTQTYARHSSSFPDGTYGGNPNGYLLHLEKLCIYCAGDTSPFAEMAWLGEDHDIDVALLPIGDCFTMGTAGSIRAARMLKPNMIIPVHYNTFPPIQVDTEAWIQSMVEAGFVTRVLKPGDVHVL